MVAEEALFRFFLQGFLPDKSLIVTCYFILTRDAHMLRFNHLIGSSNP